MSPADPHPQVKLIDFGIANAIANDTTNIQRDHQVGTVNYMSPEAIELPEGMRRLKQHYDHHPLPVVVEQREKREKRVESTTFKAKG